MDIISWVIEDLGSTTSHRLMTAAKASGAKVYTWDDEWWFNSRFPISKASPVIFHGSLENADRVYTEVKWNPGSFCSTSQLKFSQWALSCPENLLSSKWELTTVEGLASAPTTYADKLGTPTHLFVRPDSPLKQFSGRVLKSTDISLASLDHGFYYDDLKLPIIVAPAVEVGREWRLVVVSNKVVASSGYLATGRVGTDDGAPKSVIDFASSLIPSFSLPVGAYVMDVAEYEGMLRLVELNPFGGADLYNCDLNTVVSEINRLVASQQ